MKKKSDNERMAVIETEVKGIKKSLDDCIDNQNKGFEGVFIRLNSLDQKFAGKWVEKISIASLASIVGGLVVLLLQNMR